MGTNIGNQNKDKSYTAGHSHRGVLSYYIYLNFVLKKIKKTHINTGDPTYRGKKELGYSL